MNAFAEKLTQQHASWAPMMSLKDYYRSLRKQARMIFKSVRLCSLWELQLCRGDLGEDDLEARQRAKDRLPSGHHPVLARLIERRRCEVQRHQFIRRLP